MASQWFIRALGMDPNDPNSYTPVGPNPPSCPGSGKICAVWAEENNVTHRPIIDDDLQQQMITALSTGSDQTRVLLRSLN